VIYGFKTLAVAARFILHRRRLWRSCKFMP
jgi:hypothetical protein